MPGSPRVGHPGLRPANHPPCRRQGVTSMTHHGSDDDIQLNRGMIVGGGVLVALGGLLGFTGMAPAR